MVYQPIASGLDDETRPEEEAHADDLHDHEGIRCQTRPSRYAASRHTTSRRAPFSSFGFTASGVHVQS